MGKTISFGIQKGGVGKSTTSAITSWLLVKKGYKVLAVDFDSQGNLTQMLTQQNIYDFQGKTVYQACMEENPIPYIHNVSENFDILTAEDFLSQLPAFLHKQYKGNYALNLRRTLSVVKDQYDFIIIDMPPNLGELTLNGLAASDYAVALLQTEPFCYDALDRYLEYMDGIKSKVNPALVLTGILPSMRDQRGRKDGQILELVQSDYGDIVFETIIKRRSRIKDFSDEGITDRTKVDQEALEQYEDFVKELLARVS